MMSTFVGMKLHATALSICGYVPSVMIEYDPKCSDFMRSIGLESALVRSDVFHAGQVWEKIHVFNENRQSHANEVFESVAKLRDLQLRKSRALADMIHST